MAQAVPIIALALTATATYMQYEQQKSAQRANEEAAAQTALYEQQKTELELQEHRRQVQRLKSQQRTAFLTSGVTLSGTPEDVLADTDFQADLDEQLIRWEGDQRVSSAMAGASYWGQQRSYTGLSQLVDMARVGFDYGPQTYKKTKSLLGSGSKWSYESDWNNTSWGYH